MSGPGLGRTFRYNTNCNIYWQGLSFWEIANIYTTRSLQDVVVWVALFKLCLFYNNFYAEGQYFHMRAYTKHLNMNKRVY